MAKMGLTLDICVMIFGYLVVVGEMHGGMM